MTMKKLSSFFALLLIQPYFSVSIGLAKNTTDLTLQNPPTQNSPELQDINDIYPPLLLPEELNWLLYFLIFIGIIATILLLVFLLRKKKTQPAATVPTHTAALAELAQARQHILDGDSLVYAEKASGILRSYVEKRFNIFSTRQTTAEFLSTLKQEGGNFENELKDYSQTLEQCLTQCDLAKYAHKSATRENLENMEESIRTFIEETTVEEE